MGKHFPIDEHKGTFKTITQGCQLSCEILDKKSLEIYSLYV